MFILKAFDEDMKNNYNENPIISLKKLIITNSNIDIFITFVLSLLYLMSISFINNSFHEVYPINFIIFVKLTIVLSFCFMVIESIQITIITWEKYLRGLNKPQNFERNSLQSNNSRNSRNSNERNSINSNDSKKKRIEMDELDDKKNPFLSKEDKKENEKINENNIQTKNNFGSSNNYIFAEGNIFNIINNNKDYIEVYYESLLSSSDNSFYDKIFIKIYISLIKKLNKMISNENYSDIINQNKKMTLYKIIIKYPHTISIIFHFIKNVLFLFNCGLSFAFWVLYSSLKMELNNYSFNIISIILGEILELYILFRLCFFFIKIIINFILSPMYISAIFLGYYEDKFDVQLNEKIKTRFYTGKKCLVSRDSINKVKESEIDVTCAICLNIYIKGDVISTLPCSKRHSFHTYCLEEWFHTTISCPLCRCDFSSEIGIFLPNQENNNNININNINQNNNQQFGDFIIPDNILNENQQNNNNNANDNNNNNQLNINEQGENSQNIEMNNLDNNGNNPNNQVNNNNN